MSTARQYCLTLSLVDDANLISDYEQFHQPGNVWPEVVDSLREAGILDMRIFRSGLQLVMIMTVSETFSFEKKALSDARNPRVVEWETLMSRFQSAGEQSMANDKWALAKEVFSLGDHLN